MFQINLKHTRKYILSFGILLTFSDFGYAQVPPRPPPPPRPPKVVAPPPPIETSDNEDNRRRSALVSCCLRRGEGLGAYCSLQQLDTAIKIGDLIRRENPDGTLYCAEGTGVVVSQTLAIPDDDKESQGLASPLAPVQDPEDLPAKARKPTASIFELLFGTSTPSR